MIEVFIMHTTCQLRESWWTSEPSTAFSLWNYNSAHCGVIWFMPIFMFDIMYKWNQGRRSQKKIQYRLFDRIQILHLRINCTEHHFYCWLENVKLSTLCVKFEESYLKCANVTPKSRSNVWHWKQIITHFHCSTFTSKSTSVRFLNALLLVIHVYLVFVMKHFSG